METHRRGADGRRIFSAEFKREQIARVLRKELTAAELSRELGIESRSSGTGSTWPSAGATPPCAVRRSGGRSGGRSG